MAFHVFASWYSIEPNWFHCQLGRAFLLGFLGPYPHSYSLLVHPLTPTTHLPSFNGQRLIRAWLVALAGLQRLLGLTWLRFTLSYCLTTANHLCDTCVLPFTVYIIFTPLMAMVSTLHCQLRIQFTLLCTFRTRLTLKLILMPSCLVHHINPLSHPIVMHVGALKLVLLFVMVPCFYSLNAAAWVGA